MSPATSPVSRFASTPVSCFSAEVCLTRRPLHEREPLIVILEDRFHGQTRLRDNVHRRRLSTTPPGALSTIPPAQFPYMSRLGASSSCTSSVVKGTDAMNNLLKT